MNLIITQNGISCIFTAPKKNSIRPKRQIEFQAKFGGEERVLTRDECLRMEPTLAQTSRTIVGGIHAFLDACGDAHSYCMELAKKAS